MRLNGEADSDPGARRIDYNATGTITQMSQCVREETKEMVRDQIYSTRAWHVDDVSTTTMNPKDHAHYPLWTCKRAPSTSTDIQRPELIPSATTSHLNELFPPLTTSTTLLKRCQRTRQPMWHIPSRSPSWRESDRSGLAQKGTARLEAS